jgi:hypothetical protein
MERLVTIDHFPCIYFGLGQLSSVEYECARYATRANVKASVPPRRVRAIGTPIGPSDNVAEISGIKCF